MTCSRALASTARKSAGETFSAPIQTSSGIRWVSAAIRGVSLSAAANALQRKLDAYAAALVSSSRRRQLITRFQLALFWSTNYFIPQSKSRHRLRGTGRFPLLAHLWSVTLWIGSGCVRRVTRSPGIDCSLRLAHLREVVPVRTLGGDVIERSDSGAPNNYCWSRTILPRWEMDRLRRL